MIHCFPVPCAFVHVSVDSPALVRTPPDRKPPRGQPIFNMHWPRALSFPVPEEDAPRRRGIVRTSNMNPKNIGPYMEGEGGGGRKGKECSPSGKGGGRKKDTGCRRRRFNGKLIRFLCFGR